MQAPPAMCHVLRQYYSCGAQDEHQPAALTCLPGNSWHGPWLELAAPSYSAQFAHLLSFVALFSVLASSVYLTFFAAGSSGLSSGRSAARLVVRRDSARGLNVAPSTSLRTNCRRDWSLFRGHDETPMSVERCWNAVAAVTAGYSAVLLRCCLATVPASYSAAAMSSITPLSCGFVCGG